MLLVLFGTSGDGYHGVWGGGAIAPIRMMHMMHIFLELPTSMGLFSKVLQQPVMPPAVVTGRWQGC